MTSSQNRGGQQEKEMPKPDHVPFTDEHETVENESLSHSHSSNPNFFYRYFFIDTIKSMFNLYNRVLKAHQKLTFWHFKEFPKEESVRKESQALIDYAESSNNLNVWGLLKVILMTYAKTAILMVVLNLGNIGTLFLSTIFLSKLIRSFELNEDSSKTLYGTYLILCMFMNFLINIRSPSLSHEIFRKLRLSIAQLLYWKILKMNNTSLQKANIGKVINIFSNDLNFFEWGVRQMVIVFITPITLIFSIGALWSWLGPVCLMSILAFSLIYIIQVGISKRNVVNLKDKNKICDQRIKKASEALQMIRLLKLYGWEMLVKQNLEDHHSEEIKKLIAYNFRILIVRALSFGTSPIIIFFVMLSYYLIHDDYKDVFIPSIIFSVFQVLEYMRVYQVQSVGNGLSAIFEFKAILQRIIDILAIPVPDDAFKKPELSLVPKIKLKMQNFSGYWQDKLALDNLNISCEQGKVYAVIGKVGSGKSTFINAILRELTKTTGFLYNSESIGYVEQEPFIIADTVRNNIIFNREFNQALYSKIIEACCLEKDIETLSNGDMTEIGDRGTNLSGGQKTRITFARALYSQADLYLLDDPLSALDVKVGRIIFDKAIKGILKEKCVIFVTHQVQYLKEVDRIFSFENGKIVQQGTFNEFQSSLSKYFIEEEEEQLKVKETVDKKTNKADKVEGEEKIICFSKEIDEEISLSTYVNFFKFYKAKYMVIVCVVLFFFGECIRFFVYKSLSLFNVNNENMGNFFIGFFFLATFQICFSLAKYFFFSKLLFGCSDSIFQTMINAVLRAPALFFDLNQTGEVLSHFSHDHGMINNILMIFMVETIEFIFYFIISLIVISSFYIWFAFPFILLLFLLMYVVNIGKSLLLHAKLIDVIYKEPLCNYFSSTMNGLTTINAYRQKEKFADKFNEFSVKSSRSSLNFFNFFDGFYCVLDFLFKSFGMTGIGLLTFSDFEPGKVGQIMAYLLLISLNSQLGIMNWMRVDSVMISFTRCLRYCHLLSEDDLIKPSDSEKLKNWPRKGLVHLKDIEMKYRPHLPPAVMDLDVKFGEGEKIGIVGRTGAGKSSILNIIFRMYEIKKGAILIDGINVSDLGLHSLRTKVSVIPQTPFVLTGSIKYNLDPYKKYTDEAIWKALRDVELEVYVKSLKNSILTEISSTNNDVFSVGQKQLLCLARVLLINNKILVLDEATSNIDIETDKLIQMKIKELFTDCTIITIAHKIFTIADYDKVLVMGKGRALEYNAPFKLLCDDLKGNQIDKSGYFAEMVKAMGNQSAAKVFEIARNKYQQDIFKRRIK